MDTSCLLPIKCSKKNSEYPTFERGLPLQPTEDCSHYHFLTVQTKFFVTDISIGGCQAWIVACVQSPAGSFSFSGLGCYTCWLQDDISSSGLKLELKFSQIIILYGPYPMLPARLFVSVQGTVHGPVLWPGAF